MSFMRSVVCALALSMIVAIPNIGATHIANACSIDGVPSITVNGYNVVINKTPPVGKNLAVWAPFLVPFPLHVGRNEALSEIRERVSLSAAGFQYPWRWNFGDGSPTVRGSIVHHVYTKPGIYKVTVAAYFGKYKFWYTFDAAQIHVLKL
jgi:PKD domain